MKKNGGKIQSSLIWIIAILILAIVTGNKVLIKYNLLLPAVGLTMIAALILIFSAAFKSWKMPADEVVETTPDENGTPKKTTSMKDRLKAFGSGLVLVVTLCLGDNPPPVFLPIAVLLFTGVPLVDALIQKARGREGEPFFANARIRPMQIIQGLFFLAGLGFACFWCYIVASHGIWFMLPFGIGIGLLVLRPLVATIQLIIREFRDPGEKHVQNKKDVDPWDRPDKEY